MQTLKNYILTQFASKALSHEDAMQLLAELNRNHAEQPSHEMAIVGMSGRFPLARDVDQFWEKLQHGINCIADFPAARRQDFEPVLRNPHYAEFLIGDTIAPDDIPKLHARAGYLHEIDKFDAGFFGIATSEATYMDPYQRVALETAWATLEDAGYGGDSLAGSRTGVYLGRDNTNYSLYRYCSVNDPMQLTGSWESIMASRISYLFNFRGPCLVIDTACSAGLVSIHLAIQAILQGECDQAIAGGINLSVTGELNSRFQGGMNMDAVESKEGVIRTFDARASGTVWGEGVAMVLIKPLAKALADGDHIHAVIKGSAINNDGASNGLTAPNAETQEEVIVKAWEKAKIHPEQLSYIEAHGTGTNLGDPIEFKGLTSAFRRFTDKRQFCAIGSLKTNMGHLVAASGCASLFKVVKSLQAEQLAPTINFGEPNPYINFLASPLYVADTLQPWPRTAQPRLAALSSFGFSHTNCHMVVQEAPTRPLRVASQPAYCFTLSAKKPELLRDYVQLFRRHTRRRRPELADLCYTLQIGRGHYAHRLAIVASTLAELQESLAAAEKRLETSADGDLGSASDRVSIGHYKIVSDRKVQREPGELTARDLKRLSQEAQQIAERYRLLPNVQDLQQLAAAYCRGAEIDWRTFYASEPRYRLSLPIYPFERKRVWAEPKRTKIVDTSPALLHPLVHRLASQADGEHVFASIFRISDQWVLSDHQIMRTAVVPGTTYLEMARVAAREAFGWTQIALDDVFFLQPMVVPEGGARNVRTRLTRKDGGSATFAIESTEHHEPAAKHQWFTHVEGRVSLNTASPREAQLDLESYRRGAAQSDETYQGVTDTGVFQFGPHWDTVRAEWNSPDYTLARLALPTALRGEVGVFQLHPSVLDNAVNLTSQNSGATFLPYLYKSFRCFAPFTEEMYSLIRPRPSRPGAETQTYDVVLTDATGRVLVEIEQYVTKKVHSFAFSASAPSPTDLPALVEQWAPAADFSVAERPSGAFLLLGVGGPRTAALATALREEGIAVMEKALPAVPTPETIRALLTGAGTADLAGILFAPDFERTDANYLPSAEQFAAERSRGVDALFHLTHALLETKVKLSWGIAVLTTQACRVLENEKATDPLGAASLLLGTTLSQENAHLPVRLIDAPVALDAHALLRVLWQAPLGKRVAQRGNDLYLSQLERFPLEAGQPFPVDDNGVYLITGGLGGLGLAAADFLANRAEAQGKRARVALLGRSALPPRSAWAQLAAGSDAALAKRCQQLLSLEACLGALEYLAVDVADHASLATALTGLRARHGRIAGVFHAAGVAGNGFLLRKPFAQFDAVLRPKLEGTRNLLAALRPADKAFVVLYSSITALTAGEGQGDYAAANAFLDAIAEHARIQPDATPVYALNWPSWKEVGMAVDFHLDESQAPFTSLRTADAFRYLESCLQHDVRRVLPADLNPAVLAPLVGRLPFGFSEELAQQLSRARASEPPVLTKALPSEERRVQIHGKSAEDLTPTEVTVAKIYAAVLGLSEIEVFTSFQDLGGNSIIATHLLKVIDEQFPKTADISDIFSYPSVDLMAKYLDEKRGVTGIYSPTTEASASTNWAAIVDQVTEGGSIDSVLNRT